jgi:hypothetical protein
MQIWLLHVRRSLALDRHPYMTRHGMGRKGNGSYAAHVTVDVASHDVLSAYVPLLQFFIL